MNYIKELNAFRDWLIFHPLPANAIVLWHTLMMVNNAMGWKVKFQAPCSTIETLSGLKKQRLSEARKALLDAGLIRYETGKPGEAATYQMIPFVQEEKIELTPVHEAEKESDDHSFSQQESGWDYPDTMVDPSLLHTPNRLFGPNPLRNPDHSRYHPCDPFRPNNRHINKQKRKQNSSRGREAGRNPFVVYEQNFGILRPIARESLIAWCKDLGDDVVVYAIEVATKQGGRTFAYLEQILRDWAGANLSTLDEVHAYESQKKSNKKRQFRAGNGKKSLFEALRKEGSE